MDTLRDDFNSGRQAMIAAFAELTTMAWRAGADEDAVTALSARFFDGNVQVKSAFRAVILLAELHRQ